MPTRKLLMNNYRHYCSDETDVAEIAVSFDGTWSKRGYTANFGVGFLLSVETGEVHDFDFESKIRKACESTKKDLGEDSPEYDIWYQGHEDKCTKTHTGSSGSMECSIAKTIWDRSKETNLHYKFMISDGDSKAYGSIWDTYGCCNKCENGRRWTSGQQSTRNGASPRSMRFGKKTMKAEMQSVLGFQNWILLAMYKKDWGHACRNANVKPGKLTPQEQKKQIKIMQKAILAVLYHTCELPDDKKRHQNCPPGPDSWCSYRRDDFLLPEFQRLKCVEVKESTLDKISIISRNTCDLNRACKKNSEREVDDEKQHEYCPKSGDTWCKYWKDKNDGTNLYNEDNRLSEVFMDELDPIFTRLSKDDLLIRCLKGITQNQNEAANGVLWSKCAKTKFCGARRVRIAACETIAAFNTGAASKAVALDLCGVTPGVHTMKALKRQDDVRLKNAAKKVSEKYRKKRQKLRSAKKDKADKKSYQPGGFGLSAKPIENPKSKKRKTAPKKKKEQQNIQIKFVMPTFEVVAKKRRK
ncbi:Hypothetical predicted protein [Paramuricea clavata]|uniref:Mutator-like transposase domain-containing protein n=1 Tax=Paramuricea clavata TaxID=317549 RepID=A0A7D9HRT2_PARCT|nr:Hypothetical predicted protein [Paramuricea clavata]